MSKTNTPFFIAGVLATLTLLASVVFAIAPHIAFLSPIAALGISLPVIFTLFVLSVVVIAISCKIISKNKKLDSKEAELNKKNGLARGQGEIKAVEKNLSSFTTKLDEISKQASSIEARVANLESECKTRFDGDSKLINEKGKTEAELRMKFYAKDAVREDVTFDRIILPEDIKRRLEEICESQKKTDHSEKKIKGYVLYGLPGTGKTMIAKAIANKTRCQSAFISVSASDLSSQSNINKLFDKAQENTPCIIFIDEIDSIGRSRELAGKEEDDKGPLTHLLTKLDGFDSAITGVTVVAATNHMKHLDSALIRYGRLSEHIEIPPLNEETRREIASDRLKLILKQPHNYLKFAKNTEGFSPANLLGLIEEIERLAADRKFKDYMIQTVCEKYKKTHNIGNSSYKKHDGRQNVSDFKVNQIASKLIL